MTVVVWAVELGGCDVLAVEAVGLDWEALVVDIVDYMRLNV